MTQQLQAPLPETLVGHVVNGRFRILGLITRGATGRLYRAEQLTLGYPVAIKTLEPRSRQGLEKDPRFQARFFREAAIASQLRHPNTAKVFDYGTTADGLFFVAMELVEGRSLFRVVREEGPLRPERASHIALQIARSLREAHCLGLIHRDLKPANVLLCQLGDEHDCVKVLDFGVAGRRDPPTGETRSRAGSLSASPLYLSPEEIHGGELDARTDIYALGLLLYEMLSGRAPFERGGELQVLLAQTQQAPAPLGSRRVPVALRTLVMRCLEKAPQDRPASMDEVILALKHAMGAPVTTTGSFSVITPDMVAAVAVAEPHEAASGTFALDAPAAQHAVAPPVTPPGSAPEAPKPQRTHTLPLVAVCAALLVSTGFLGLRLWETQEVRPVAEASQPRPHPVLATAASEQVAVAEAGSEQGAREVSSSLSEPPSQVVAQGASASEASEVAEAPEPPPPARLRVPRAKKRPSKAPAAAEGAGAGAKPQTLPAQPRPKFVKARALPGNQAPSYPWRARRRGIEGNVKFAFDILPSGEVGRVVILSGPEELHDTVVDTVNDWRFRPPTLDGVPVKRRVTKVLTFKQ